VSTSTKVEVPTVIGTRIGRRASRALVASSRFLRASPLPALAGVTLIILVLLAVFARWLAPHNPLDMATVNLLDSKLPPSWIVGGDPAYLLGTDNQGRDILSLIFFGLQSSLAVGFFSILAAMLIGVPAGLISGYVGGLIDTLLMRVADAQLSFPAILIALLIGGIAHGLVQRNDQENLMLIVLIVSIALSQWVMFARLVRSLTQVEKEKEYVLAAKIMGINPIAILIRHILPNTMGPLMVLATINVATSILLEATLSFLGVGLPPTSPSLGTLIRIGNEFLFSGMWWIAVFPGLTLIVLSVAVNLLGDWLRDHFDPAAIL
jgi:peptide/nickel transport system permease protein